MSYYCNYPSNSNQDVFAQDSAGKYFAYLSNRQRSLSYLSDHLIDFNYNNNDLYKAMPMGYTALTVLKRLFLLDREGMTEWPSETAGDLYLLRNEAVPRSYWQKGSEEYHLILATFKGESALTDAKHYSKQLFEQIKNEASGAKIVGAAVMDSYNWH
ncbi:hypothetical protein M3231_19485 [Neobacillus mesonae]|nr:hypothetical protein [Neobacillus mesonae]